MHVLGRIFPMQKSAIETKRKIRSIAGAQQALRAEGNHLTASLDGQLARSQRNRDLGKRL